MEKEVLKIFPTLVHYYRNVLSPVQLNTIREHCMASACGIHGAFIGESKSSFSKESRLLDLLEVRHESLKGLCSGLAALMADYAKQYGFDSVKLTNSWFNIQKPGSVLKHHVHPDSKVSAALYVQTDSLSSKLFLENPNVGLNYIRPSNPSEFMFEFVQFQPNPGDLILFPSWIKHGSGFEASHSENRIVISINAA